jgi:hypothetical protein
MTMEIQRTKARHGREDGRKEKKKTERLLKPDHPGAQPDHPGSAGSSGPTPGSSG